MDQANIEARVERLFKEAKPRSKPVKKGYLKLAAALLIAAIPLSVTQIPNSQPLQDPPIIRAVADTQDPTIQPTALDETDETLTMTINQPTTVFFCGCAHSRTKVIDAFKAPNKPSDV